MPVPIAVASVVAFAKAAKAAAETPQGKAVIASVKVAVMGVRSMRGTKPSPRSASSTGKAFGEDVVAPAVGLAYQAYRKSHPKAPPTWP